MRYFGENEKNVDSFARLRPIDMFKILDSV